MKDRSLCFEVFSMLLLITLGSSLVLSDMPGWGLIIVGLLLATLSLSLRLTAGRKRQLQSQA